MIADNAGKYLLLLVGAFIVILNGLLAGMPGNLNDGLPLNISCVSLPGFLAEWFVNFLPDKATGLLFTMFFII